MTTPPRVLVVTGGTEVDLGPIHRLTNNSGGAFGLAIADLVQRMGNDVRVLASRRACAIRGWPCRRGEIVPFRTYDDLAALLHDTVLRWKPHVVFVPAAISDYGPAAAIEGKLALGADPCLRLRALPKLIDTLRPALKRSFLIGFKQTAGDDLPTAVAKAQAQNARAHLNLTVLNRVEDNGGGAYHGWICTPEGGVIPLHDAEGCARFATAAAALYAFVERRRRTTWSRSVPHAEGWEGLDTVLVPARVLAATVLREAQSAGRLYGPAGNLIVRTADPDVFLATPRGVDKGTVRATDLVPVRIAPSKEPGLHFDIEHPPGPKPSIDTSAAVIVLQHCRTARALLHTHEAGPDGAPQTEFSYPCGTVEAAEAILAAGGPRFRVVRLLHHGLIEAIE